MDAGRDYDFSIFQSNYSLPLQDNDSRTKEQILLIATIHFAKNGYASVTMRDIAKIVGIQQSSIYNHFESKEALWKEVLAHTTNLYMLYFKRLDQEVAQAATFADVLDIIFHEPKLMRNVFTCYAFSMIQAEQFRDEDARAVFCETFLDFSVDSIQGWFDQCVARGMAAPFDTGIVATIIMNSILICIEVSVHRSYNRSISPHRDPAKTLEDLQKFLLQAIHPGGDPVERD